MDCAIAEVYDKSLISNKIATLGRLKGINKPSLGLKIKKIGMATGVTEGEVATIGVTKTILTGNGKSYIFKNQVLADIESSAGDSGALIVNYDNEAVELHFAGNSISSIFTDISVVLNKLGVELFLDETGF